MTVSAQHQYEITFNTLDGDLDSHQTFFKGFKFWSPNVWDLTRNVDAESIPLSNIGVTRGDGMMRPLRLSFYGLKYYNGVLECMADVYRLRAYLSIHQNYFVIMNYWSHSLSQEVSMQGLFGRVVSVDANPVEGAQYTVWQPVIRWEAHDPFWYTSDSPKTREATMTAANLTLCTADASAHYEQQRYTTKIEVNIDAKVIKNPRVQSNYDSDRWYQITGELSAIGDYWLIDHINGTVTEHDASAGTDTPEMDKFSGYFWRMRAGSDVFRITSDPAGDTDLKFTAVQWKIWAQT